MKAKRIAIILLLASLAVAACGVVSGSQGPRTLSVNGTGVVRVKPDVVTVTLGVQTRGGNVSRAVSENNRLVADIHEAVRQVGVADEDIRTTSFNVYPQTQSDEFGNPSGETVYWVDNAVTVTLRQIDELGALLESALNAGANSIRSVSYSLEDQTQAEEQARQQAMEAAQSRAQLMADALGATLGEPLSITTNVSPPGPQPFLVEAPAIALEQAGGGGVPVAAGSLQIQAQVTITYEVR